MRRWRAKHAAAGTDAMDSGPLSLLSQCPHNVGPAAATLYAATRQEGEDYGQSESD